MCSFLADDPLVADLSLTPCIEKVSGEDPPYYTQFYLSIMAPTGSSNLPFAQTFASSAIAACTAEVCYPCFVYREETYSTIQRSGISRYFLS